MKTTSLILMFIVWNLFSCNEKRNGLVAASMASSPEKEVVQQDFRIYSNANTRTLTIVYSSVEAGRGLVIIYYPDGKLLSRKQVIVNKGKNIWEYLLPEMSAGVYLVRFRMNNIERAGKIFKSDKSR